MNHVVHITATCTSCFHSQAVSQVPSSVTRESLQINNQPSPPTPSHRLQDKAGSADKAAAAKALIVAQYAVPDRAAEVAEASTSFTASAAQGISQGNALARHLAELGDTNLYPQAPFHEAALQRAGDIDAWMDFGLTAVQARTEALTSTSAKQVLHKLYKGPLKSGF